MKILQLTLIISVLSTMSLTYVRACTGGTNSGALSPTLAYQTIAVNDGEYYTVNVVCGQTFHFDFCNNGGNAGSLFPELTILNAAGTVELLFAPFVGGCAEITWTANFTGSIRILITDTGCGTSGSFSGTMAYNVSGSDNAAYTLNPSCDRATSVISGTPGGTFSWNPSDPGDGAVLNTATGEITNITNGSTYNTTYTTPCGSSSSQSATISGSVLDCWSLNGDAQFITVGGEQCIQLTDEINDQLGCAWNGSQIDFSGDFNLTLDYYFGDNNTSGADGNTFTFQTSSSNACGIGGGQMGAGGIANSLSIEFDTYDNDNPAHIYDLACDHIAIDIDGDLQNAAPLCGPICAKASGGEIDDGGIYTVSIEWDATTEQLDIYFDGALRLSCTNDFITNAFAGNNMVFWGATSATGGFNNQQYFCPSTIIVLPAEMVRFESRCTDELEILEWETASERNLSHFTIEYTYDGFVFVPLASVDAAGNSQTSQIYNLDIIESDSKQRYYRIKSVDNDGEYEYSDIIRSESCKQQKLIHQLIQTDDAIIIKSFEDISTMLINQFGQSIPFSDMDSSNKSSIISKENLANGIYYLQVRNTSNVQEVVKIIISK